MLLSLRQAHWGRFHTFLPYFVLGLDLVNYFIRFPNLISLSVPNLRRFEVPLSFLIQLIIFQCIRPSLLFWCQREKKAMPLSSRVPQILSSACINIQQGLVRKRLVVLAHYLTERLCKLRKEINRGYTFAAVGPTKHKEVWISAAQTLEVSTVVLLTM
jgi:hypothetical protein